MGPEPNGKDWFCIPVCRYESLNPYPTGVEKVGIDDALSVRLPHSENNGLMMNRAGRCETSSDI